MAKKNEVEAIYSSSRLVEASFLLCWETTQQNATPPLSSTPPALSGPLD